ncbi:MAG: 5-formyltetrahydrofolate cyclo-ligase [Bacteroidetes bacterium]|nr:MAG: 5-formyltetrahydrofolate cyclo-ligase [Bacteroidota bacterium]
MTKQAARTYFLQQRMALTLPQQHALMAAMLGQFEQLPIEGACSMVLSYRSLAKRHEVPVAFFEAALSDRFPEAQICYPAANFDTGSMQAYLDDDATVWQTVRFGIEQPIAGQTIDAERLDLIFVPLLAFDKQGNRVGYGKGFYDQYLATCRPNVITVGFSFFESLPAVLDIQAHDVPLKYCVTPQALYEF